MMAPMADNGIGIKGIKEGLLLTISPDSGEWMEVTGHLTTRIDQQPAFFKGARVAIDVGTRPLRSFELESLKLQLSKRELTLWAVVSDSETTHATAKNMGLETSLVPQQDQMESPEIDPLEASQPGVLIDHTLRNGRTVRSAGHVTIIGDVNPGAEIVAVGNIIIWGKLRGRVHAGADGNEAAVVCALDLAPMQLRIAGYISTAPDDKHRKPRPEMASVRHGRIIAEVWNG